MYNFETTRPWDTRRVSEIGSKVFINPEGGEGVPKSGDNCELKLPPQQSVNVKKLWIVMGK